MTMFTATQAAEVCAVSVRTVQRKMSQLEAHGAYKDAGGQWHIPVAALSAVGLSPGRPKAPDSGGSHSSDIPERHGDNVAPLVSRLREEKAELLRRAEVAEAIAAERLRTVEALTSSIRALESATGRPRLGAPEAEGPPSPQPVTAAGMPRRRTLREWWGSRVRSRH